MIDTQSLDLEKRKLSQVIREYRRRGYDVVREPAPEDLPAPLREFRPDAIATLDGDRAVIEVKTRQSLAQALYLPRLAEAVQALPGWRLDLLVTNPRHRKVAAPDDRLDLQNIRMRMGEARELVQDGSEVAALLLAWSAVEGALRLLAAQNGVTFERDVPEYILRKLVVLGHLGHEDYRTLRAAVDVRNSLVHGYSSPRLKQQLVTQLTTVGESLLA